MVSATAARVLMVVTGLSAISQVQAQTSLSLSLSQEFYIQVLSEKTGSNTGYLDNTGQTHTQCHLASPWQLIDESLFSGNGNQLISVGHNVLYVRFGVVNIVNTSSLDHSWVLMPDGFISWQNRAFTNGAATFGKDARGILYAIFTGPGPGNLISVFLQVLNVKDCHDLPQASSSAPTARTSKISVTPSKTVATSAFSSPPTSSVCNDGISSVDGQAVTTVTADVEGTFQNSAATAYDCCVSCQNEAGCQYAEFSTVSGCTLALASGQCAPGSYYTNATAPVNITLYNGTCGGVTYGGTTA